MQLALFAFRLGRRGREARRERDAGRDARGGPGRTDGVADCVGDASGRGGGGSVARRRSVEMVWRLPLETRRGAGRVRGAVGSWGIGGLGGKLSHRAFVKFT